MTNRRGHGSSRLIYHTDPVFLEASVCGFHERARFNFVLEEEIDLEFLRSHLDFGARCGGLGRIMTPGDPPEDAASGVCVTSRAFARELRSSQLDVHPGKMRGRRR
jgi:hypothetical protein